MRALNLFLSLILIFLLNNCCENSPSENDMVNLSTGKSTIVLANGTRSDNFRIDEFQIVEVNFADDTIRFLVRFSGGCNKHEFKLTANDYFKESFPVQADMVLSHNGFGDACDSIIEIELSFDLSPLKAAYLNEYNNNSDPIIFNILVNKENNDWRHIVYQPSSVYFNSFETDIDTDGWTRIDTNMFVDEHAPGGGTKSLFIGGGCLMPTASRRISIAENGDYSLSCWGKTNVNGGTIRLCNNDSEEILLTISGTEWSFFQSTESVYFEAGSDVKLEIWVGGIIYDDLFCDNLAVIKK